MNTNAIHNILNVLIAGMGIITTMLVGAGCTQLADKLDCTLASVPAWLLPWVIGIAGALSAVKVVMNLVRDGFSGLFKQQPPVASEVKTVVVTGDKDSITKVVTDTAGGAPAKVI